MNRLQRWCVLVLLFGLTAAIAVPAAAADKPQINVILFGWDGAQRNHVNECLQRGELPVLKKLGEQGAHVAIDIEGTTDTKAGWSQILTGYYPEVTGVYGNGRYQSIPEGLSIPERLEKHFGDENIFTGCVIGKKGHVDADPPKKIRLKEPAAKPRGKKPAAAKAGKARPRKLRPQGNIVEEGGVKYRVIPGKTLYYVTADHGFDEGQRSHRNAPYVLLTTNDKRVNRDGRRQDVAPTILEAFGLELGKLQPPLDGISLTKPDNRQPAKIGPGKKKAPAKKRPAQKGPAKKKPRAKKAA